MALPTIAAEQNLTFFELNSPGYAQIQNVTDKWLVNSNYSKDGKKHD
ncbi:MAG: hypothetical protein AAF902_09370 [Chloroflexota bacterium]